MRTNLLVGRKGGRLMAVWTLSGGLGLGMIQNEMLSTYFLITSLHNLLYDAVVSRRDAEHYGMLGLKTRR